MTRDGVPAVVRVISDETVLVFVSDCHIGGDDGRDIFESSDDLAALFDDLAAHPGPLELVLAGDFFDCLRITSVPSGTTRVGLTLARPEYAALFAALKRLAAGAGHRVVYLPGNHDAEVWWNQDIRAELVGAGLIHEIALSYAVAFAADPSEVVYCEHGNEFDPANTKHDYADPWDTPFGDHVVTDIIPRLPHGRAADALQLHDVDRVFPLDTIPAWMASKLFYALVTMTLRWLLVPLAVAYVAFEFVAFWLGFGRKAIQGLFVTVTYDIAVIVVAASVFFFIALRIARRAVRRAPASGGGADAVIRRRLERGQAPPLGEDLAGRIAVFVSGHTHRPALTSFVHGNRRGVVANSGCWLRQLQRVKAHLHAPAVFAGSFVQTHVRVARREGEVTVELWELARPARQSLRWVERLAILGRLPPAAVRGETARMRARDGVRTAG